MYKRILGALVVIALVMTGGVYAYRLLLAEDETADGPVYATAEVHRDDMRVSVEGFGRLNPMFSGNVRAEVDGTVETVKVQEGDEVTEGDVVARQVSEQLEREIRELQTELDRAKQELTMVLGVDEDEIMDIDPGQGISITAPIDGRVTDLRLQEEEIIQQGSMVTRIVDDSMIRVTGEFNSAQFSRVDQDMEVELRPHDFSGTIPGVVIDANSVPIPRGSLCL